MLDGFTHFDPMNQLRERCHEREAVVFVVDAVRRTRQHLCVTCDEERSKDLPDGTRTAGWTSYGPNPEDTRFDER